MSQYIARRLLLSVPVILGVALSVFLVLQLTPGDPALLFAGQGATPEQVEAVRRQLGLDRPVWEQGYQYVANLLKGDLGRSLRTRQPVSQEIARAFPRTLELVVVATIFSTALAIPLGTLAAVKRGSLFDKFSMVGALLGVSLPTFALGLLLMWAFAYKWHLFPVQGDGGPIWTAEGLRHVVLPAITLGLANLAALARMTRSCMLEVLGQDYIRTARAKGLSGRRVVFTHALRNAILPVLTLVGVQFGYGLAGAVITETIFARTGMGRLMINGISNRDYPLVQGVFLVVALNFVLVNLLTDIIYAWADPRVRYE